MMRNSTDFPADQGAARPRLPRLFRGAALLGLLLCGLLTAPSLRAQSRASDPELAGALSLLLPGIGQYYIGQPVAGTVYLGTYLGLASQYYTGTEDPDYIKPQDREDTLTNTYLMNRHTFETDLYGYTAQNLNFYSAFAAYRDARLEGGNRGAYSTNMPDEGLGDLVLAPFNPEYMLRPGTFLPLLLPLYVASLPADREAPVYAPDNTITLTEMRRGFFFMHYGVAIGEEALFRGYFNNGLSDWMGEGWGLVTSSLIFGLAHTGTAGQATAAGATVFGLYTGWLQQSNDYSISQGVALHFWWNFLSSIITTKERGNLTVELPLFFTF